MFKKSTLVASEMGNARSEDVSVHLLAIGKASRSMRDTIRYYLRRYDIISHCMEATSTGKMIPIPCDKDISRSSYFGDNSYGTIDVWDLYVPIVVLSDFLQWFDKYGLETDKDKPFIAMEKIVHRRIPGSIGHMASEHENASTKLTPKKHSSGNDYPENKIVSIPLVRPKRKMKSKVFSRKHNPGYTIKIKDKAISRFPRRLFIDQN